jgi:hypothetical protein
MADIGKVRGPARHCRVLVDDRDVVRAGQFEKLAIVRAHGCESVLINAPSAPDRVVLVDSEGHQEHWVSPLMGDLKDFSEIGAIGHRALENGSEGDPLFPQGSLVYIGMFVHPLPKSQPRVLYEIAKR